MDSTSAITKTCPTALFSLIAIITASLWGFWCRSFKFEGNSWSHEYLGKEYTITADDLHFSPWYQLKTSVSDVDCTSDGNCYVYTQNDCIKWGSDEDTKWNFSKVASAITVAFGGFLTFLVLLSMCVGAISKLWYGIAALYLLVCTLFQGLTFLVYNSNACDDNSVKRALQDQIEQYLENAGVPVSDLPSLDSDNAPFLWDDDCTWDKGSSLNVVAIVFWFLAGVTMIVLGAPLVDEDNEPRKTSTRNEQPEQARESGAAQSARRDVEGGEPDVEVSAVAEVSESNNN